MQNTAATIMLVGCNLAVLTLFGEDINAAMQSAYAALNIPTLPSDTWSGAPLALVCILGLVAKDFADYWTHRVMHTTWLWPTHAAHHSDTHVNAFTLFRVHFLESFVMGAGYILILTWMQMPKAIPIVYFLAHLHGLYVHTNLPFRHGPFKLLIASPTFHRWHHADVEAAHGKNIANLIPAWDKLFGTYYTDEICDAPMGALKSGIEDKNPFAIVVYPAREWHRLIRSKFTESGRTRASSKDTGQRATKHA